MMGVQEKVLLGLVIVFAAIVAADKPSFLTYFENVTAEEDSRVEIPCVAIGDKPITYEWYNQYEDKITRDANSPIFVSNSENGSSLVIPKVMLSHEGMYTCSAGNQHGLSSKIYQLLVLQPSNNETSTVRGIKVVSITSNSVKFDLSISEPVKVIEVKYSESRDATEHIMEWKYGDNYEVKGLISSGLYSFRFRLTPSENDLWSKPFQVTLLPDVPEVIFRNVEVRNVKFEWLRTPADFMRQTIDRYELTYFSVQMQGGSTWLPNKCTITIKIPSCAGSSYTISGLSSNTYYEIQLRAHTASGYGEPYKQKIFISQ